jgi:hypothetical protein
MKKSTFSFFHSVKASLDSSPKAWMFVPSQVMDQNYNSNGPEKIQGVRVLDETDIYSCIDNSYGLNKHMKFNPIKGLSETHGFTQSNRRLKT